MGRKSGGYGSKVKGFSSRAMAGVGRAMPPQAAGTYPRTGRGAGQYGSTQYPTVIEAYNRETDYQRWRFGQEYWFGVGKTWADLNVLAWARLTAGPVSNVVPLVTTIFPSATSSERSWHVSCRPRGSIIIPGPLTPDLISLDQSAEDTSEHRLIVDVATQLSLAQLQSWSMLIGDQFEDSATGAVYPDDLIGRPADAVALTLVDVDVLGRRLVFDLSRQFTRISRSGRIYWKRQSYDPAAGSPWGMDSSRHLCSSYKFECSCPDYQGRMYADLGESIQPKQSRFPLPNTAREQATQWEKEAVGYFRQWRDLSERQDSRRECKHIHATRWGCGVPFDEPGDYPVGDRRATTEAKAFAERSLTFDQMVDYYHRQLLSYDRWLPGLAHVIGLNIDPPGDLRNSQSPFRPDDRPVLWNDADAPLYSWCRQNDWWLRRGSSEVRIFTPSAGGFSSTVSGAPVLEVVEPGTPGAPVLVP